jgi:hypothetical protein
MDSVYNNSFNNKIDDCPTGYYKLTLGFIYTEGRLMPNTNKADNKIAIVAGSGTFAGSDIK